MAITRIICRVDSNANSLTDLIAALTAASLITEIKYQASEVFVFSTPLTSKVIKIDTSTGLRVYRGDAWTSGTTITNESQFADSGHDFAELLHLQVITDGSTYVIFHSYCPTNQGVAYIGQLTNGDIITFGLCTRYDQNSSRINWPYNLTSNSPLMPIGFGGNISFRVPSTGAILTMPLMWTTPNGDLQMNGTEPAGTLGLLVSSICNLGATNGNVAIGGGTDYILTGAPLYRGNLTAYPLLNSLLIPLA